MVSLDKLYRRHALLSPPVAAAVYMVTAALFFAFLSALIRHLTTSLHPFEVAFFRNLFGLAFMLPWLLRSGLGGLRTGRLKLYWFRSLLGLLSMLCWFSALALIPFTQAIALSYTSPLFTTMGAALILGETVRLRRWTATLVGFAGVIIILRPGVEGLSVGQLLAIASSAISAVTVLMVKELSRTEPTNAVVTYMVLLMTPLSLVPALFVWQWPGWESWPLILGLGAFGTLGHLCYTRSFALADASAVMPYDYTRLLFVAVLAWFAFSEAPDLWTYVGAAVIVASAIYIARREAQLRRSKPPRPAPD